MAGPRSRMTPMLALLALLALLLRGSSCFEVYIRQMKIYQTHERSWFDSKPEVYVSCDDDDRGKVELNTVRQTNKLYTFDTGRQPITFVERDQCRECRVKEADPYDPDDDFGSINICEKDFHEDGYAQYTVPGQFDMRLQCEQCIVEPEPEPAPGAGKPDNETDSLEGTGAGSAVSANVTAVSGNGTAISGNGTAVSANVTAVSANGTAVSGNGTAVSANVTAVSGNGTAVSGNGTAVSANVTAMSGNGTAGSGNGEHLSGHGTAGQKKGKEKTDTVVAHTANKNRTQSRVSITTKVNVSTAGKGTEPLGLLVPPEPVNASFLERRSHGAGKPQAVSEVQNDSGGKSRSFVPIVVTAVLLTVLLVGVVCGAVVYRTYHKTKEQLAEERMAEFESILGDPNVDFENIAETDRKAFEFKLGVFKSLWGRRQQPWSKVPDGERPAGQDIPVSKV